VQPILETTILVTGATDGLGKRVARDLATKGAKVLLHGRSKERAEATLREIREETDNDKLEYYLADFSSLKEVRHLAAEICSKHERLDVLVNNAGIGAGKGGGTNRELSRDSHELRFAVNYLAPFLLTNLLLPLLCASVPARIITVASEMQTPIDFDDLMLEGGYAGVRAYAQSKLALISFTFELAERLEGTGVGANCLHPATFMPTKMVYEAFVSPINTIEQGTDATVRLIASPELEGVTGRYFDGQRESRAIWKQAYDPEARKRLWTLSERLCAGFLEPV